MPGPQTEMDYLQATTSSGHLHASSCDWGDGDGERFRACMEAQGFTVTRYTAEEARALRPPPGSQEVQRTGPELKQSVDLNEALRLPPNVFGDWVWAEREWQWRVWNRAHAVYISARRQLFAHVLFGRPLIGYAQQLSGLHAQAEQVHAEVAARWERDQRDREAQESPAAPTPSDLPEPGQEVITPLLGRGVVVTHLTLQGGERVALVRGPRGEGMARAGHWEAVPVGPSPVKEEAAPVPLPELPPVPVPPGQWVMPSLFEGLIP